MPAVKARRDEDDGLLPVRVPPTQRSQGRRPTAQSRRTRERVLDEAARCIAEEGFAAAHTNRIAERAGVSWGVLQYHFGDKNGLLSALLEQGIEALEEGFRSLEIPDGSPRERIQAVVDGGWELFRSPLARAGNEILVNVRGPAADADTGRERLDGMTRKLARAARGALRRALGHAALARRLEGVYLAAMRGFNLALLLAPTDYDFAAERRTLGEMMWRMAEPETGARTGGDPDGPSRSRDP